MKFTDDFQKYAVKHRNISSTTVQAYRSSMTPYIMEEREMNVAQVDVFSRMMIDRIIFMGDTIDERVANIITAQLLYMESVNQEPIKIYINSPGGSVYDGLAIYDTMQIIGSEVQTICTGLAASMGAILLSAGEQGKRFALPHSRIMIHQPLGYTGYGQASDIKIYSDEIQKLKTELYEILAQQTKQTQKKITTDAERDYWMTSKEAKAYGLIDEIFTKRKRKD